MKPHESSALPHTSATMPTANARGLSHRGYFGSAEYSPDDHNFHGRVLGLRDVIAYHAVTAPELEAAFRDAVDDYLDWCASDGEEPERPYSGTVNLRMGPELHRAAVIAAELSRQSLNSWILGRVTEAVLPYRAASPADE